MKLKEVVNALECFAPLPLQDSYDNAGLQIGLTEREVSGALLCLDVTEAVIEEAVARGCNLIVNHHPLLFRGVKRIADENQVQRCVRLAIEKGVAIYAAHTNLDNVDGGVNHVIAEKLGVTPTGYLAPHSTGTSGSGLIGDLPEAVDAMTFLHKVKAVFGVEKLTYTACVAKSAVQRIAMCGGAGDFLLADAVRLGADVFLTGEMRYHDYFGRENDLWIGVMGHYESEQYTVELLQRVLAKACPSLPTFTTQLNTNPLLYL